MEVVRVCSGSVAWEKTVASLVEALMIETTLNAYKTLTWLLLVIGSLSKDNDLSDLLGTEKRFPFGDLSRVAGPVIENKDATETDDDEDNDNDVDDGDDDDDDFSGEDGSVDEGDLEDDSDANGNGGSDDDGEDDEDGDNDDDEDDEEDDEEEKAQPPSKKKKCETILFFYFSSCFVRNFTWVMEFTGGQVDGI